MGIGKSTEKIDKDKISIKFGDFTVAENGSEIPIVIKRNF